MEEKIIVKSERYNIGKGLITFLAIAIAVCVLWGVLEQIGVDITQLSEKDVWTTACIIPVGIGLICLIVYAWLHSYEIVVTDKRVYGKAAFGKRVDLPVDSVSAIGSKSPKGIAVATSSGKIAFLMIKNCEEVHKCVSDLLIDRQSKPIVPATTIKQEIHQSNAEELKKYKDLLDMGVISQEEFDAKKKQLLGL